jgi:hypothetical protein
MEQSPNEAHSFSSSQKIHSILSNAKVHYHTHKSPLLVPVLCQIILVHKRILFIEGPFEYYPPVYAWIYQVVTLLPSGFDDKSLRAPLLSPIHARCPTNSRSVYRQQMLRKYVMFNEDTNKLKLHN